MALGDAVRFAREHIELARAHRSDGHGPPGAQTVGQ